MKLKIDELIFGFEVWVRNEELILRRLFKRVWSCGWNFTLLPGCWLMSM